MKQYKKIINSMLFGFAMFGVASVASAATLNNSPQDYATLRTLNYTQNPTNTAWSTSAAASAGQEVSFAIYYHNTGSDTATNLRVQITPQNTVSGTTQSFSASVWADNAPLVSGSAMVYLSSSQTIDFETGTVIWRPNQTVAGSSALINGQTGNEIFSASGLNLGSIAPGWSTQGSVVLRYRVSNNGGGGGGGGGNQAGSVTTYTPSNVSLNSANLSCFFNNNNTSGATGWFEWGSSSNFGNTVGNQNISSPITLNYPLTGLQQNTTYFTRCAIQNQYGVNYGQTLTFATSGGGAYGGQPLAVTYPASSVYMSTAILNGYVNPQSSGATRWFEWGSYSSNLNNSTIHVSQNNIASAVSESISGFAPNQTYYFRLVAQNGNGTSYGDIQSFTAGMGTRPLIATKAATELASNHATLNGHIDTNGSTDTSRWFEWGTSYSLGNSTGRYNPGNVASDFGESVIGLNNNTTYYFRAVAENSSGRIYGDILSFKTGDNGSGYNGPSAVTLSPENVTTLSAKLNGAGLLSTNVQGYGWFEWGGTADLGNSTSMQTLARVSTAYFSEQLGGLSSGATYYYRAVVKDANGIVSRGSVMNFRAGTTAITYPPVQPKTYQATVTKSETNLTHPNGTNSNLSAAAGDTIRFTIEVVNSGDYKLEDVVARDRIPDYLEFANADQKNANNPQREVTWYIGAMEPGAQKSMTLDVIVTANAPLGFAIVNTANFQSRKVNAASNEVSVHVDPIASFTDASKKDASNSQTASTFFAFGGLGFFWFNILFTLLVAAFVAYVVSRLMKDRQQPPNSLQ